MGIQGIYQELGPGQRVALSKLAADTLAKEKRPFRLAIDIAIWQFQAQAAKGGVNPAIRTLFYRLVRLMGTPIQPIFVFDGPNKPSIKRNKRSGRGDGVAIGLAKRLIRLFGFVVHDAPGEGEAECALLQRHGIVDAVLSEDVDTIMFGCSKTLRNWSAEGKGAKTPTHVTLYDVEHPTIADTGIDREGMVLVALMSGGDYLPDGIPGCGIKVAYQAAIAGFGKSICRLKGSDKEGIRKWRESLIHELKTNESKFFRTRHKSLEIPDDFPNLEVLRCYTHPVVSQESSLDTVRQNLRKKSELQLDALREFTRETFDWDFRGGALKYMRVLGEALLVHKLQNDPSEGEAYVKRISTSRKHSSTDGALEFRLTYIPEDIVPIDLSKEVEEEIAFGRDGLALNSDDEFEEPDAVSASQAPKTRVLKVLDPTKPELAWVLEDVARRALPDMVQAWEEKDQAKARKPPAKTKAKNPTAPKTKQPKKPTGMPFGSMNNFVRSTKSSAAQDRLASTKDLLSRPESTPPSSSPRRSRTPPPREPSKQPTELPTLPAAGMTSSSQVRPRTTHPPGGSQTITILSSPPPRPEAIVIPSSSPAAPAHPPAESSPRPRVRLPRIEEAAGCWRMATATGSPSKGVRARIGREGTRSPGMLSSPSRSPGKMRQISIEAFTTRLPPPSMSPFRVLVDRSSRPRQRSTTPAGLFEDDDVIDLTPDSPTVSRKRDRDRPPGCVTPSPRPLRKKLLIPVSGNGGYFEELEVDVAERDQVAATTGKALGKRGIRGRVLRMSDLAMIDLSEVF